MHFCRHEPKFISSLHFLDTPEKCVFDEEYSLPPMIVSNPFPACDEQPPNAPLPNNEHKPNKGEYQEDRQLHTHDTKKGAKREQAGSNPSKSDRPASEPERDVSMEAENRRPKICGKDSSLVVVSVPIPIPTLQRPPELPPSGTLRSDSQPKKAVSGHPELSHPTARGEFKPTPDDLEKKRQPQPQPQPNYVKFPSRLRPEGRTSPASMRAPSLPPVVFTNVGWPGSPAVEDPFGPDWLAEPAEVCHEGPTNPSTCPAVTPWQIWTVERRFNGVSSRAHHQGRMSTF